jgi:hypothetical protein
VGCQGADVHANDPECSGLHTSHRLAGGGEHDHNVAVRLFRAPRITVTCDCGLSRQVAYGESYVCDCGLEWSTDTVPADDYAAIRRLDRRYRMVGWGAGLAYGLFVLYTMLVVPGQLLLVLPAGMLAWFGFLRPIVRRRHYRAIQALTRTWHLRPVRRASA